MDVNEGILEVNINYITLCNVDLPISFIPLKAKRRLLYSVRIAL